MARRPRGDQETAAPVEPVGLPELPCEQVGTRPDEGYVLPEAVVRTHEIRCPGGELEHGNDLQGQRPGLVKHDSLSGVLLYVVFDGRSRGVQFESLAQLGAEVCDVVKERVNESPDGLRTQRRQPAVGQDLRHFVEVLP